MINKQAKIVVVGSANTDMTVQTDHLPQRGVTVIGGKFIKALGGKGANQAVAAARLGAQVTFVTRLGRDMFGEECQKAYLAEGINLDYLSWDDQETSGIALILIDAQGNNYISVASGANLRLSAQDVEAAESAIQQADCLLLQQEIPAEAVQKAAKLAQKHDVRVILNPAPARSIPAELLNLIDILTPNEGELEALLSYITQENPSISEPITALCEWIDTLIITLGAKGALIQTNTEKYEVPAFPVHAVDTTAAGDAFNGALAVALAKGENLREAVRYANRIAAISVTRLGAQTSLPSAEEVEQFFR